MGNSLYDIKLNLYQILDNMQNSSKLYIIGISLSIPSLIASFGYLYIISQITGILTLFVSISILWIAVFVEGVEDGEVNLNPLINNLKDFF